MAVFVRCKGEAQTRVNFPDSSIIQRLWKTETTLCSPESSLVENTWHVGQTFWAESSPWPSQTSLDLKLKVKAFWGKCGPAVHWLPSAGLAVVSSFIFICFVKKHFLHSSLSDILINSGSMCLSAENPPPRVWPATVFQVCRPAKVSRAGALWHASVLTPRSSLAQKSFP